MSYLANMVDEEIKYICSVIPEEESVHYFQHYPKEFSKIRPGFRTTITSLSKLNIPKLLYTHKNKDYISSFIEKHISRWLLEIDENRKQYVKDGCSNEKAILRTLPISFFSENLKLYFKLNEEDYEDDYLSLLQNAVVELKQYYESVQEKKEEIRLQNIEIDRLNAILHDKIRSLEDAESRLYQASIHIRELKEENLEIGRLKEIVENNEYSLRSLKDEISEKSLQIQTLSNQLSEARLSYKKIEKRAREHAMQNNYTVKHTRKTTSKPKRPIDLNEFIEFVNYNLEDIGVRTNEEYYPKLINYLSKIVFTGIPIVINRLYGLPLIRCISNSLVNSQDFEMLIYKPGITIDTVADFLFHSKRIVCLDNFIGNFNETELIPLFCSFRDKIIFLTCCYDQTLKYVSKDFFAYCHYLNISRIQEFLNGQELKEDPTIIEEVECEIELKSEDNRYKSFMTDIIKSLDFPYSFAVQHINNISSENDLCEELLFSVLPFCTDVLNVSPYNTSEKVLKYAGPNGRCPLKETLMRWFL